MSRPVVRKDGREKRVAGLRAEGWSVDRIAAELRISQARVYRVLADAERAPSPQELDRPPS